MHCKLCGQKLDHGLAFFCRRCWFTDVPAKDRVQLHQMHCRKFDTSSKLEAILRKVRAKKGRETRVVAIEGDRLVLEPVHIGAAKPLLSFCMPPEELLRKDVRAGDAVIVIEADGKFTVDRVLVEKRRP